MEPPLIAPSYSMCKQCNAIGVSRAAARSQEARSQEAGSQAAEQQHAAKQQAAKQQNAAGVW
jgi:hypothetical protein